MEKEYWRVLDERVSLNKYHTCPEACILIEFFFSSTISNMAIGTYGVYVHVEFRRRPRTVVRYTGTSQKIGLEAKRSIARLETV